MKRISHEALAQTDELLNKLRGVASVTSDHLEAWWSTKSRVRRLELYRLLNDLADDGRVVKLPGHRWGLPGNVAPVKVTTTELVGDGCTISVGKSGKAPVGSVTVTPTMPVQPKVSIVLSINGKPEDAVTITGQVKERVEAVVRAYQRDAAKNGAAYPTLLEPGIPFPARGARFERGRTTAGKPQPKVDTRRRPATGTIAHKILKSLQLGPKCIDELICRLDVNANTLRGRLSELVAGGWLAKGDDGRWEVIS